METKKIEKVDLDELHKVRDDYSENNMKLGMISADEYLVNQQLKEIDALKQQCFETIESIKNNSVHFTIFVVLKRILRILTIQSCTQSSYFGIFLKEDPLKC